MNSTPHITHMSVHDVRPEHIETEIVVFESFAIVKVNVGKFQVSLFTDDERSARSIVALLGIATIEREGIPSPVEALV